MGRLSCPAAPCSHPQVARAERLGAFVELILSTTPIVPFALAVVLIKSVAILVDLGAIVPRDLHFNFLTIGFARWGTAGQTLTPCMETALAFLSATLSATLCPGVSVAFLGGPRQR